MLQSSVNKEQSNLESKSEFETKSSSEEPFGDVHLNGKVFVRLNVTF